MKKLLVIAICLMGPFFKAQSQEKVFEKTVKYSGQRIAVQADLANQIQVTNWDKKEVKVKVSYEINGGDLNDILDIDFREQSSRTFLKLDVDEKKVRSKNWLGDCDEENTIQLGNRHRSGICSKILVEVFLPNGTDLDIEAIIADVVVEGKFEELHVKTVTGDVDITWPESDGAEIEIKTVNGAIYTNFPLDLENKGLPVISTHNIETVYKDKNKYLSLKTVTSNIYLRKG